MHIYILGPKLLQWNVFQIPQLSLVVRTNFSADLLIFAIFDHHFPEFVALTTNENENYVVLLKEQCRVKKAETRVEISL